MPEHTMIYSLHHEYELDDGEIESKQLGVYSSRQRAQEAIERYRLLDGFREHPNAFAIYESILDRDAAWTDGYISWDEADKSPH